jgi:hypothetical protein
MLTSLRMNLDLHLSIQLESRIVPRIECCGFYHWGDNLHQRGIMDGLNDE